MSLCSADRGHTNIWPHCLLLLGSLLGSICCEFFLNVFLICLKVKRSSFYSMNVEIIFKILFQKRTLELLRFLYCLLHFNPLSEKLHYVWHGHMGWGGISLDTCTHKHTLVHAHTHIHTESMTHTQTHTESMYVEAPSPTSLDLSFLARC